MYCNYFISSLATKYNPSALSQTDQASLEEMKQVFRVKLADLTLNGCKKDDKDQLMSPEDYLAHLANNSSLHQIVAQRIEEPEEEEVE